MFIVSLLNKKREISFNLGMFPKFEHAEQLAQTYQYAVKTGYEYTAVRLAGSHEYICVFDVGCALNNE